LTLVFLKTKRHTVSGETIRANIQSTFDASHERAIPFGQVIGKLAGAKAKHTPSAFLTEYGHPIADSPDVTYQRLIPVVRELASRHGESVH
jgi:hypothetical protein